MNNITDVDICSLCKKLDRVSNMDFQTCELTGLSGYTHYQCSVNDFDFMMEMVDRGEAHIVIWGDNNE